MDANAAFYYEAEGFDTSGPRLMGRHAAGEGFLSAFVRHSGVEPFHCYAASPEAYEDFTLRVHRLAGAEKPTRWIPRDRLGDLETPGCLFFPGPNIAELAWQRRYSDARAFSLCGVTHTTASHAVLDAIGQLPIAPLQPWDAIICTSSAVKEMVEGVLRRWSAYLEQRFEGRAISPVRLPVIPLGVDCDGFADETRNRDLRAELRARYEMDEEDVAVLFLGRLSYHAKAHPLPMYLALEEAARRTGKRLHLIQAGWFANRELEKQFRQAAKTYAPSLNAIFLDGRDKEIRASAWCAADIFTSLSDNIQETFGLAPIEGMAAGLPVVVTDWDGYRETVRDGIDGFTIPTAMPPPGAGIDLGLRYAQGIDSYDRYLGHASQLTSVDVEACVEAYSRLVADPGLRRRMGDKGRERAREKFDWPIVVHAYQRLWEELADARGRESELAPLRRGAPANPLRDDPFTVFEGYPSTALKADTVISLTAHTDAERAKGFRSDPITAFASPILAELEDCEIIMRRLRSTGPSAVADILSALAPERRPSMHRTLLWLAKTNLIRIHRA